MLTYAALRLTQHRALKTERIRSEAARPHLSREGRLAAIGIATIGAVLLVASALDWQLGLPTFACGVLTTAAVLLMSRQSPWPLLQGVSWGVLPLVAGLFVMVEALVRTGAIAALATLLHDSLAQSVTGTRGAPVSSSLWPDNIANNLPVGLVAGSVVGQDHLPAPVIGAVLIGVDLGPNLSVTGSLATILWLVALRREDLDVGTWHFLRLGIVVMPPALLAALACVIW